MNIAAIKMRLVTSKALQFLVYLLPLALFFSGCASYRVAGEMQPGRYALMRGQPKVALGHFQRAADLDPNSTWRHGGLIKEGVWTYVGRAHYAAGDYPAARKALEQARSRHPDDYIAPLYLGLVASRAGDYQVGSKEIQTGLTGLGDWLDWIEYKTLDGYYWDPGRIIRSQMENDLVLLKGREVNWPQLIASVEHVGMEIEREAEEVLRQKRRDRRDSAKGDGKSN
jgi:tetratricopeptide (TPR) repeat protein